MRGLIMKALTTPSGNFGPFASIEVLADRYRGLKGIEKTDLPFTVVGLGTIVDASTITWPEPPPPPPDNAPILAELEALDKKNIRTMREWIITQVTAPQRLKDDDVKADDLRKKLK